MPQGTTNWNIQKPNTGEQDLAGDVASAYNLIDSALLTPDEKKVTKGTYTQVTQSGLVEQGEFWDEANSQWLQNQNFNAMHRHKAPVRVRYAENSTSSSKVGNKLSVKRHKGHNSSGSDKGFYATDEFDGSAAKTIEVSAADHTHSVRDIPSLPWVYSGTTAPENAGLSGVQTGDIYIRIVE